MRFAKAHAPKWSAWVVAQWMQAAGDGGRDPGVSLYEWQGGTRMLLLQSGLETGLTVQASWGARQKEKGGTDDQGLQGCSASCSAGLFALLSGP